MKGLAVLAAMLLFAPLCRAETWAEVRNGGGKAVPLQSLNYIQATLRQTVEAATGTRASSAMDWHRYLIQYRGTTLHGLQAIEIHGSCEHDDSHFPIASEFYDEQVFDGGECYFVVYFIIKTRRYSNVIFHGFA